MVIMRLKHYIAALRNKSHSQVNLATLLEPFRLSASTEESSFLLVGHILDDMEDQLELNDVIDPLDVAYFAWELGYEPAKEFLKNGPALLFQLAKLQQIEEKLLSGSLMRNNVNS